jgi:ribonuclease Z
VPEKLDAFGIRGPAVKDLQIDGELTIDGKRIFLDDVSYIRKGDSIAVVLDTRYCQNAIDIAQGAKLLLCESTYLDTERDIAHDHYHMTAKQAAELAKAAGAHKLVLTHFSARYLDSREFELEARKVFPNAYAADDFATFELER